MTQRDSEKWTRELARWATLFVLLVPLVAFGVDLGSIAASYDGTRSLKYFEGDKPIVGCTSITTDGYALADLGTGDGEICKAGSGDYDLAVLGGTQPQNMHIASKDAGAGDVQVEGRIDSNYAGTAQSFANVGVELREAATTNAWVFRCHSLQSGTTAVQCQYGSAGTYTTVNGAAGQSRPRYVAVTYDISSGDVRGHASADGSTWTEVANTNRAMSDVLCAIGGTSRSTTETLTATIDNYACGSTIDTYTPTDPPGGGTPTVASPIDNQSFTQGDAFSLDVSANFTGETSCAVSGLPGSTGISFNTATCTFSGTFNANDVGTRNITVTPSNGSGAGTADVFQLTVISTSSGSTFLIATSASTRSYNCGTNGGANGANWSTIRQTGSASRPQDGDTVILDNGNHGPLTFLDCVGTASSPVTLRNDITGGGPAVIQKSTAGGRALTISGTTDGFVMDGTQGYVGVPAGVLGINESTLAEGKTQAGIKIEDSTPGASAVSSMAQVMQYACAGGEGCIFKGIEVDAGNVGMTACFQVNHHDFGTSAFFREFTFTHNYFHDCGGDGGTGNGGVGLYLCWPDDPIHCRNVTVSYNLIEDTGFDSMNIKGTYTGDNRIHHNVFRRANHYNGSDAAGTNGISIGTSGNLRIYSNIMEETDDECVRLAHNPDPPGGFDTYLYIYDNIFIRCGGETNGEAVAVGKSATGFNYNPASVYNNTIIDPGTAGCIFIEGGITASVRNNICAGSTAGRRAISGGSQSNNLTSLTTAQNAFVNAGADNYELTVTSAACNAATNPDSLTLDFEDEVRPQDGQNDQGADEAAACP